MKLCLHCFHQHDDSSLVCDACSKQKSPDYEGEVTGRQLIRALRLIGAAHQSADLQEMTLKK